VRSPARDDDFADQELDVAVAAGSARKGVRRVLVAGVCGELRVADVQVAEAELAVGAG